MSLVASQTLHYVAGNKVELELTVEQDDAPVNVSGMDIRFVAVDASLNSVLSTEESDASASVSLTDATNGRFRIVVEPEATRSLQGTYRWQCEVEDSNGGVSTVARGFLTFSRNLISSAS